MEKAWIHRSFVKLRLAVHKKNLRVVISINGTHCRTKGSFQGMIEQLELCCIADLTKYRLAHMLMRLWLRWLKNIFVTVFKYDAILPIAASTQLYHETFHAGNFNQNLSTLFHSETADM